jgi:hypothetical protein
MQLQHTCDDTRNTVPRQDVHVPTAQLRVRVEGMQKCL